MGHISGFISPNYDFLSCISEFIIPQFWVYILQILVYDLQFRKKDRIVRYKLWNMSELFIIFYPMETNFHKSIRVLNFIYDPT